MESIFTDSGVSNIVKRIDALSPAAPAQWGKMNVSQMLAHCQAPLNVGIGAHQLGKYNFILRAVGSMVKKSLVKNDKPFKRSQPTDKSFIVADPRDFEKEKSDLKNVIREFSTMGRSGKLAGKHPFFGALNAAEWDMMQWKHLDHHLRQFGV